MDHRSFVDSDKALLIAPAGYGKTHTIVECLRYTTGRQLILTHTHAGVSSIKEKIMDAKISRERYSIETISSFSQKYLKAFYMGTDTPEQDVKDKNDPTKDYHSFVIRKTGTLLLSPIIKQIIMTTYSGLFVDEYQDCTKSQHNLIMEMAKIMPTRVLGDPLQGIFDFNGEAVNLKSDLQDFQRFPDLDTPHRWFKEGNNSSLGVLIKEFRDPLKNGETINVSTRSDCCFYVINVEEGDFENPKSNYREKISSLILNKKENASFESLLIIVPEYTDVENGRTIRKGKITDRVKILSKIDYTKSVVLLEAIDDGKFYSLAKKVDHFINSVEAAKKPIKNLHKILSDLFYISSPANRKNIGLNDWVSKPIKNRNGDYYIKTKQSEMGALSKRLNEMVNQLIAMPSKKGMFALLLFIKNDLKIKIQLRKELLSSLIKVLDNSLNDDVTVFEAMKAHKNIVRRVGRKVKGKCIGTTLLTKGLEFDTVAILDAHKFECPKHLYVALTRCCKNLVIFTSQNKLPAI